ncbi:peptidase inhibitor family I36 protein [Streptomyces sp. NPDC088752]|uniref:peptidase inhibitor family I36 protein n=1 Tax=Streptomyces sp. NPDC088752 TaxID=3154963 RepID=UPI0034459C07
MMKAYALAVATMASLVAASFTGTTASASAYEQGDLILGQHQNLNGKIFAIEYSISDLLDYNDEASSVFNNSDEYWILYDDKNYRGGNNYCIRPGERIDDLHKWKFGDKISSIQVLQLNNGCRGWRTFDYVTPR